MFGTGTEASVAEQRLTTGTTGTAGLFRVPQILPSSHESASINGGHSVLLLLATVVQLLLEWWGEWVCCCPPFVRFQQHSINMPP
jgi:hypothetical protein